MAERYFKKVVRKLYLSERQEFRGEGILAVTKALLQTGISYVAGYQGAPISYLMDVLSDDNDILMELASLRRWRPAMLRFEREQQRITARQEQVKDVVQSDYALALEVAECPRLVKGYGDISLLGSRNGSKLMQALPRLRRMENAAVRLHALRQAALADDTGKKLASVLAELNPTAGGAA